MYSERPSLPVIAAAPSPSTKTSPASIRSFNSLSASTVLGSSLALPPSKNLSRASPPMPADTTANTAAVPPVSIAALWANSWASPACPTNNPSAFNNPAIGSPAFSIRLTIFWLFSFIAAILVSNASSYAPSALAPNASIASVAVAVVRPTLEPIWAAATLAEAEAAPRPATLAALNASPFAITPTPPPTTSGPIS